MTVARRVVITGVGMLSALGDSMDAVFESLLSKNVSFERSAHEKDVTVCPIKDFNIREIAGRNKYIKYLNRGARFAVASAISALKNAGLSRKETVGAGLFIGQGPNLDLEGEFPEMHHGPVQWDTHPALWMLKFLPNTAAALISLLMDIHGENFTIGTACAASLQAIGEGYRKIKDGYLDIALCGGGDSRLSTGGIMAYKKAHAICREDIAPEKASRPFDERRKGFVPGEGGACFVLESLDLALQRGARIYGEVCGFGASMDGYNMTAPAPDGRFAEIAVQSAIKEAGLHPGQIDVISSHGTGTRLNDERESDLILRVFKGYQPFVIALKSWIGHLASACGCVELAMCLAVMQTHYLPEIRNLENPCTEKINFVKTGFDYSPGIFLIENFGFGGQNCALIVKQWNS